MMSSTGEVDESSEFVSALARGLAVLECFGSTPELSLSEIVQRVGLTKTTTFRLVRTLLSLGYIKQNEVTQKYCLGPRVLGIGYAMLQGMELKEVAFPYLQELSQRCGEAVNMAVLDGSELVYIERIKTQQIININLHIGSRLPLYNTSLGRALIAYQSAEWLTAYIAKHVPASEAGKLIDVLQTARKKGYTVTNEDLTRGLRSVATQIWDSKATVVAAVNIAAPSARITMKGIEDTYAPQLIHTANQISAALGYKVR